MCSIKIVIKKNIVHVERVYEVKKQAWGLEKRYGWTPASRLGSGTRVKESQQI